jgi:hypothetical protein
MGQVKVQESLVTPSHNALNLPAIFGNASANVSLVAQACDAFEKVLWANMGARVRPQHAAIPPQQHCAKGC